MHVSQWYLVNGFQWLLHSILIIIWTLPNYGVAILKRNSAYFPDAFERICWYKELNIRAVRNPWIQTLHFESYILIEIVKFNCRWSAMNKRKYAQYMYIEKDLRLFTHWISVSVPISIAAFLLKFKLVISSLDQRIIVKTELEIKYNRGKFFLKCLT